MTRRSAQVSAASARMSRADGKRRHQRRWLRPAPDRPGIAGCRETTGASPPDIRMLMAAHVVPSPTRRPGGPACYVDRRVVPVRYRGTRLVM